MEYIAGERGSRRTPIKERLEANFQRTERCWVWTGYRNKAGYGVIGSGGDKTNRPRMAHRIAYELYVAPVPVGMELHHRCQNKACVNPAHLQVLTRAEHSMMPGHVQYNREMQTHCRNGHPWSENRVQWKGGRRCVTCSRLAARAYHAKKREARSQAS